MSQANSAKLAATLNYEIDDDGAADGPSSCRDTSSFVKKKKRAPGRKWSKRYMVPKEVISNKQTYPDQDDEMDDDMGEPDMQMKDNQDIEGPMIMSAYSDIFDPGYDGDCEEA